VWHSACCASAFRVWKRFSLLGYRERAPEAIHETGWTAGEGAGQNDVTQSEIERVTNGEEAKTQGTGVLLPVWRTFDVERTRPATTLLSGIAQVAGGKGVRSNLITVLACDEHNLRKSRIDEDIFVIISSHHENNGIAQRVFRRVIRGIKR
jgi:hypothetical protein